jgi:hypothetical protein
MHKVMKSFMLTTRLLLLAYRQLGSQLVDAVTFLFKSFIWL